MANEANNSAAGAIKVADLKFSYDGRTPVLDIPELTIKKGEHVFLHGPSGSGKTTLLGLMAGILTTSTGTIEVLGQDYRKLSGSAADRFRGEHIGYIFQMFNLVPYLNVRDNIMLPYRLNAGRRARLQGRAVEDDVTSIASHLRIDAFLDRSVTALSVGQQQRVAAARALLGGPDIVIADEPTSALDADHRRKFIDLLFRECQEQGSTLVFVSHDHSLSDQFATTVSLPEINRAYQEVAFA